MAFLQFDFDIEEYDKFLSGIVSLNDFLEEILKDRGLDEYDDGNYGTILSILVGYHDGDGGAPEIHDFHVVDSSYDIDKQTGKVEIQYWVNFYYGCSDIDSETDDHENWVFNIDLLKKWLIIVVPDYEQLSPTEEL